MPLLVHLELFSLSYTGRIKVHVDVFENEKIVQMLIDANLSFDLVRIFKLILIKKTKAMNLIVKLMNTA